MQLGTGTPNLLPILFRSHFCDSVLSMHPVDLLIQFIAGHSCIRNNIVNVPAPTLAEYRYFSLSRQHIESTKIHLVESVIIQKKRARSNGLILRKIERSKH